jgi:hypothetical protein
MCHLLLALLSGERVIGDECDAILVYVTGITGHNILYIRY